VRSQNPGQSGHQVSLRGLSCNRGWAALHLAAMAAVRVTQQQVGGWITGATDDLVNSLRMPPGFDARRRPLK
jgi:hypothetical protein